jgi:NAD+ kinase
VLLLAKPEEDIMDALSDAIDFLRDKGVEVLVERFAFNHFNEQPRGELCLGVGAPVTALRPPVDVVHSDNLEGIDLVISFGGDGLLMHCNTLFGGRSLPPAMCFDFGSMSFLSSFAYVDFEREMTKVMTEPIKLTLRMRLECTITRADGSLVGTFHVLNEAVVDRGPSPFLSNVDMYCDEQYLTTVQGDGVIIATPTGSTAYSLAAGGSMVHPSVPAILLTPICPHTLSFRPLLLPDSACVQCVVPEEGRSSAWVSFDGKFRQELGKGDMLEVKMSPYPIPTVNSLDFSVDWFNSLRSGFMFNERPKQKPLGRMSSSKKRPSSSSSSSLSPKLEPESEDE